MVDFAFREDDEGMFFILEDVLSNLHRFSVSSFAVDTKDPVLLENPLSDPSLDIKNVPGGHEVERQIRKIGNLVHCIRVGMC